MFSQYANCEYNNFPPCIVSDDDHSFHKSLYVKCDEENIRHNKTDYSSLMEKVVKIGWEKDNFHGEMICEQKSVIDFRNLLTTYLHK